MKVLVMNGSPKGEHSDVFKLTKAFLEGMEENDYEVIDTMKQRVNPCRGCYSCWWGKTPGKCIQNDGMEEVLHKITDADLVIWSYPLYCYGMPSNLKAYIDRLLPLSSPTQEADEEGNTYHPVREEHEVKMLMISGCGFPNKKGNYDGALFVFQQLFCNAEMITCVEAPMLSIPEAAPLANKYLELVKKAGKEYKENGCLSDETKELLDIPMMDPDEYRKMCSAV